MFALVAAMLLCVAAGVVVVGYVVVEARRTGQEMWTPEGEQLIADVRRRSGRVRSRGEQLRDRAVGRVRPGR